MATIIWQVISNLSITSQFSRGLTSLWKDIINDSANSESFPWLSQVYFLTDCSPEQHAALTSSLSPIGWVLSLSACPASKLPWLLLLFVVQRRPPPLYLWCQWTPLCCLLLSLHLQAWYLNRCPMLNVVDSSRLTNSHRWTSERLGSNLNCSSFLPRAQRKGEPSHVCLLSLSLSPLSLSSTAWGLMCGYVEPRYVEPQTSGAGCIEALADGCPLGLREAHQKMDPMKWTAPIPEVDLGPFGHEIQGLRDPEQI